MTVCELMEALGGQLAAGDGERVVARVASFDQATAGTLVFAEDERAAREALASQAGIVVLRSLPTDAGRKTVIADRQPKLWFAKAAARLAQPIPSAGVHPAAVVDATATLGEDVTIAACAVVGAGAVIGARTRIEAGAIVGEGVTLGADCRIFPRAVVYAGATLGNRVVLHAGAVIGADGFGYVRDNQTGRYTQFPQQGSVVLEDDVEIGANSTVDRGALEETRIGRGTKIDNLVHVGHNCQIGSDVILVTGTGISGSSKVGNNAILAGQVGIGDHVTIGPGVILGGQSGVFNGKTLTNEGHKPGTVFFGTPARPLTQVMREQATVARLVKKRGN